MKLSLVILLLCVITVVPVFGNNLEWVDQFEYQQGVVFEDHIIDNDGNTYITGYFRGTYDFNPGAGTTTLSSVGNTSNTYDIFILKINSFGTFQWAKRIGGTTDDFGHRITYDSNGDILVAGYSEGTVDFDPNGGVFNLNSNPSGSNYVLKLSSAGNFIWAKINIPLYVYNIKKIAVDNYDNILIAGGLQNTRDFDAGAGTTNLTSNNFTDIFIQKLDVNGDFIWAKSFEGSDSYDLLRDLTFDDDNNIYTIGEFTGTVDFNPNFGTNQLVSNGPKELFIQKLDENGNYIWAKNIGGDSYEVITDILIHNSKIYTTGYFYSTIDVNPGAGIENMTSAGNYDAFFLKLDLDGNYFWSKQITGSLTVGFGSLFIENDKIVSAGALNGTVNFDPSGSGYSLTEIGIDDFCILELDTNGIFLNVKQIGNTGARASATRITKDNQGNRYIYGAFRGTIDFDYNATTNFKTSSFTNQSDRFLLKYDVVNYCFNSIDESICAGQTYNFGGQILSTAGIYKDTITTVNCDSIITLNLSINNIQNTTIDTTICYNSNYTFADLTTVSNIIVNQSYTSNFTSILTGCDSNVTENITVLPELTGTHNETVCFGESILVNGTSYDASNLTGIEVYSNIGNYGCDSTVTVNLTILPAIDVSVTESGATLMANNSTATYLWLENCNSTGTQISGETNQTFNVLNTGNYAVIVTEGNCIDTSDCYFVQLSGLDNTINQPNFTIYPNPANHVVSIESNISQGEFVTLSMFDITGKLMIQNKFKGKLQLDISSIESGIYVIRLQANSEVFTQQLVIE